MTRTISKSDFNFEGLEAEKIELIKEVNNINCKITDVSKANAGKVELQDKLAEKKAEYYARLGEAKGDMQEELFNLKAEYRNKMEESKSNASKPLLEAKKKLKNLEYEFSDLSFDIDDKTKKVNKLTADRDIKTIGINKLLGKLDALREEYLDISNKTFVFDDTLGKCPACGREYDNIEEIKNSALENFNKRRDSLLKENIDKGTRLKNELETLDKEIEEINNKEVDLDDQVNLISLTTDENKNVVEIIYQLDSYHSYSYNVVEHLIIKVDYSDYGKVKELEIPG